MRCGEKYTAAASPFVATAAIRPAACSFLLALPTIAQTHLLVSFPVVLCVVSIRRRPRRWRRRLSSPCDADFAYRRVSPHANTDRKRNASSRLTQCNAMELIHKRLTGDDRGDSDVSPRRRVLWLLYSCDGNTLNRGYKTRRTCDDRALTPKRRGPERHWRWRKTGRSDRRLCQGEAFSGISGLSGFCCSGFSFSGNFWGFVLLFRGILVLGLL